MGPTSAAATTLRRNHHRHVTLLFFFFLTIQFITSLSASPTPPPSSSSDTEEEQQVDNIIDALLGTGDFKTWSNFLSSFDSAGMPIYATLFLPEPPQSTVPIDPFVFPYHFVPQRLSLSDLRLLPPLSRLPTLLPAKTILITNTSVTNFTIDDTLISHPDFYITDAVAIHGIAALLDYKQYGDRAGPGVTRPSRSHHPRLPQQSTQGMVPPPLPPPAAGGNISSSESSGCYLEFPTLLSLVYGVLVLKTHRYYLDH